ncbi:MAG: M23 family metallopeptidase [Acidobacteriota bacterium]
MAHLAVWLMAAASVGAPCPEGALAVTVDPAHLAPGEPLRATVHQVDPGAQVKGVFLGRELAFLHGPRVTDRVAFAGVDLQAQPGRYPLVIRVYGKMGVCREQTVDLRVAPREFPIEQLKVAPRYVHPPPEVSRRIEQEAALLQSLWKRATPAVLFDGRVVRPFPGVAGRNFGRRRVFNGEARSPHAGVDLSAPEGEPVPASASGRVILAREFYYSGNLVVLDHGGSVYTLYAHLSSMAVQEGEDVEAGEPIGRVGATGRVTGPHLHWGAHVGGARVDPAALLKLLSTGDAEGLSEGPAGRSARRR